MLLVEESRRSLAVPVLEAGRALRQRVHGLKVYTPDDLALDKADRRDRVAWALAMLRSSNVRWIRVPGSFPTGAARALEQHGLRVDVVRGDLFPERVVKTARELANMRQAQRAATRALWRAVDLLRRAEIGRGGILRIEGRTLTSERVRRAIDTTLLENDCLPSETIVAGGAQGADPHERGTGPLRAGEPIVVDIFPRHLVHGYWADLTRTLVKGRAPDPVRRMHAAVKAAHAAALAAVRAGAVVGAVHASARDALERRGFATTWRGAASEGFIHNTGHGVGLEVHEAPTVGEGDTRLAAGNVITIEPGLYYRAIGGVRIEDTVVVTGTGARPLVRCPCFFEV